MPETSFDPTLIARIRRDLLARTPADRVAHVMGVEGMAVVLGRQWNISEERCLLAALLHDLAKPYSASVQREKLERVTAVTVTEDDRQCPAIWHGLVAAQEAQDVYDVADPDIPEAVAFHSTGVPRMAPVGLVLYVADFIEPSRSWKGVEEARKRLRSMTLEGAALEVARMKHAKLERKGHTPHPRTRQMQDWLESVLEKGN